MLNLLFDSMFEKRKEESESVAKYTSLLTTMVIAALLVFLAPLVVEFITGDAILDEDGNLVTPDNVDLPANLEDKIGSIFSFVLWVVRIVIVMAILLSTVLLRLDYGDRSQTGQA